MTFDWQRFLDSIGMEYVERGPNVARGHINIRCPWCGPADPSHHFGIRLEDGAWGCLRNSEHRGRSAIKLVMVLGRYEFLEAKRILEEGTFPEEIKTEDLRSRLVNLDKDKGFKLTRVRFPKHFRLFTRTPKTLERRFHSYLAGRGFDKPFKVAKKYGLRWSLKEEWSHRIIFPLMRDGKLYGWTGRAITKRAEMRYRTFPYDETPQHLLFNETLYGEALVLVEGPFDSIKMDFFGRKYGIRFSALLGTSCPAPKMERVAYLDGFFRKTFVLMDQGALSQALRLSSSLSFLGVSRLVLPEGVGDPGRMDPEKIKDFCQKIRSQV